MYKDFLKKETISLLLTLLISINFAGCAAATSMDMSAYDYAKHMPDPSDSFSGAHIEVVQGSTSMVWLLQITDFKEQQYLSYVQELKDAGFTTVIYESYTDIVKSFIATNEAENINVTLTISERSEDGVLCIYFNAVRQQPEETEGGD